MDRYHGHLVLQTLTLAMDQRIELIANALRELLDPQTIVLRNDSPMRKAEGLEPAISLLHGSDLVAALCAFPVMLGGTWLGGRLFALTSERRYRLVSLSVLLATALSAGARGLSAML